MKTNITNILALVMATISFAQQGINYKAQIKDDLGNVVASQNVDIQFIIYKGAGEINNAYQETHASVMTDVNGVIIVNIGEGAIDSGVYAAIDWSSDDHYLNVWVNTGSGLTDLGTTQLMAVPYALHALTSGDKSWESEVDNVHVLAKNVGIGTNTPTERLEINDPAVAGIELAVPVFTNTSKIEFKNGPEAGPYSFYKIENNSDILSFQLDTDISGTGSGFIQRMSLSNSGLALQTGSRVNEFSSDVTLSGSSNTAVPTENAVKTYVDNATGSQSKTIFIPAYSFTVSNNNIRFNGAIAYLTSGNATLYAPIILPVGATITSVTVQLVDNDSSNNLEVSIFRAFSTAGSSVLTLSSTGASPQNRTYTSTNAINILDEYQYYISVRAISNWTSGGFDFGINRVKLTYTE